MKVRGFPSDDRTCGWYELLPAPKPARRLDGDQRADWVVLGAGVTGLAAARRLAEHAPEARVVLLEAERVGVGASGRNSGFAAALAHQARGVSLEGKRRRARLGRAGISALGDLVERYGIDCDWDGRGRLQVAAGDSGARVLERFRRDLDELGEAYKPLDAAALSRVTGTTFYRAGLHVADAAILQPAALVRGLAAHLPSNVELIEESPVLAIEPGPTIELRSANGSLETPRLLLATNAFTPALGFLERRMFPLFTASSLTRPLTPDEQAALGGDSEWGLVPEEPLGSTVRRTRDQRILIRNSVRYAPRFRVGAGARRKIREVQRRSFLARFPMLERVGFDYSWGGVVAITIKGLPWVGQVEGGVYAAAGYNGSGVALGTACGALLADLAVGADSELLRDVQSLPAPGKMPPRPLLEVGVRALFRLMGRRAGSEV